MIVSDEEVRCFIRNIDTFQGDHKKVAKALREFSSGTVSQILVAIQLRINDRRALMIARCLYEHADFIAYLEVFFENSNASTFFPSSGQPMASKTPEELIIERIGGREFTRFIVQASTHKPHILKNWRLYNKL